VLRQQAAPGGLPQHSQVLWPDAASPPAGRERGEGEQQQTRP
jgi:hypothetical protein